MRNLGIVSVLLFAVIFVANVSAFAGLVFDVTGPGGIGVKEVQPGLVTGEIWATVTGSDSDLTNEALQDATGGLQLTGSGTFLPYDPVTNNVAPFNWGVDNPNGDVSYVDLSADGKTLGHAGLISISNTGVLYFRNGTPWTAVGNGPFQLSTFQANMQPGDSIQFLLSGSSFSMYVFQVDGVRKIGIDGRGRELISVGAPLIAVPEPSTLALLLTATLGGLLLWRRRR